MSPAEISGAVIGGLVVLGLSVNGVVAVIKTLRGRGNGHSDRNGNAPLVCPLDASDGMDRLIAAVDRMAAMLGEVRDRLVAQHYQGQMHGDALGRVEQGVQALHRRLPGGRE